MTKAKTIADLNINISFGCNGTTDYYSQFKKLNPSLLDLKIKTNLYNFNIFIIDENYSIDFTIRVKKHNNSLFSLITRINNIITNCLDVHPMRLLNIYQCDDNYFQIVTESIPF